MVSEADVREALREVYDPEIPVNIVDLGLIYEIEVEDERVKIEMTLTSMGCPIADQIFNRVQQAAAEVEGVEAVELKPTWDPPWSPEKATEDGQQQLRAFGLSV